MSGPSISWSNVDYSLSNFIKKSPLPQVVKVKKDAGKSSAFKNNTELVLHETKTLKKLEARIVSEDKTFVIPYDCPAKVYQLTKAEEYSSLGDLRKALPTCRFFLVTSKPKGEKLQDLRPGEVLTIVFKKTIVGSDVFTCERKKLGVKIEIQANALGGFAPMGTVQERKISDFVRHYSTFPVGIALSESTLANKSFGALNNLISQAKSGLIQLTRLFSVDVVVGSTLGKKKMIYAIPNSSDLKVIASKDLLLESVEHKEFCRKLHEDVDKTAIDGHLNVVISLGNTESEVLQWWYGDENVYDDVAPLASGKGASVAKVNGEVSKRDGASKETGRKISNSEIAKEGKTKESKEKIKEKDSKEKESKEKEKVKEKSKEKDKQKDKKTKEAKAEKVKVEKVKSNEKPKIEKVAPKEEDPGEPVEDESGYLVPAELLKAQREHSLEEKPPGGEGKERSSIGISLGRFMDKVKGKKDGKKGDRPASSIDMINEVDEGPQKRSATMPANSSNKLSAALTKNKAKTMSADELSKTGDYDDTDGPGVSPKEAKKRDKGVFSTAGRKAGAKIRHKLGKNKANDEHADANKPASPTTSASSLPPSPNEDDFNDQDMYVTPVDDQPTGTKAMFERELPEIPPEELRKPSTVTLPEIPYDDDDLYDEINPVEKKTFKIPKDLSKLSPNDISEVLRALNMREHVSKFKNEQIDGEIFKSLDDKTLGALGVIDPVQRLKIKKLLKGWRPKN